MNVNLVEIIRNLHAKFEEDHRDKMDELVTVPKRLWTYDSTTNRRTIKAPPMSIASQKVYYGRPIPL